MTGRREFLRNTAALSGAAFLEEGAIVVDPTPLFDISPGLFMQFMEPLGVTDSSVEAAWDYTADDWRKDFVDVTKDLAPGMMRFGGNFSRYYKWREGVGPVNARPRMRNYDWGGVETNRVGTQEFVDFSRRVGAEPFYCVNFLGDGHNISGRTGDAREAADWVSFCNDPDNKDRRAYGASEPYNLKTWQIGNETSYGKGGFSKDEAIAHTIEFAKAMRQRDPGLKLIGWGDGPGGGALEGLWAADMLERAGDHLDSIAIHMMGQRPLRADTVLRGLRYQAEPERAWNELLEMSKRIEMRVKALKEILSAKRSRANIAVTEGHLSLPPHNANPILYEWLTGVFHAISMNTYQRHGDRVKIATAADFCGTRWTVNAVMLPVPGGRSYLMPVASVMRLFRRYNGSQGIHVSSAPTALDIAASRTQHDVWLHVANTSFSSPVTATFQIKGHTISGGQVFEIAPQDPREYVNADQPDTLRPVERTLPRTDAKWQFPARSVSAVRLTFA
ncbi:MAG: alpha-L-arabinofuranosidase C-terminal domain-containing protein [Bryobacteraceae bacterium]